MSLTLLVSASCFSYLVSTAILLPPSPVLDYALQPPQPPLSPILTSNITVTTFSSPNVLRIQCDGINYGRNLNPGSCLDVFHYMGSSDDQATFSQRHTGRPNDVPLPLRIQSNDGLCFVQPTLKHGSATALASAKQIGEAAYTLQQRCVVERGLGGIATEIGGDNNLNVIIADSVTHVRCDKGSTRGPPWESCLVVISDMKATQSRKVFGDSRKDPRVEVNLPYYFKAIDARCQIEVNISGKSTSATWYEIWEAVTALASMCVRGKEKGGKAFGMGLRKNIYVQLSDEHPDLRHSAVKLVNVSASAPLLDLEGTGSSFE